MKIKKILAAVLALTAALSLSCTKGPAGPAGADTGNGAVTARFQSGVYPDPSYAGESDTRIIAGYTSSNYGACNNIDIGYSTGGTYRGLVRFTGIENYIPANAAITKASLTVYVYYMVGPVTARPYQITANWTEGASPCGGTTGVNVSWYYADGTSNPWATYGGDYNTASAGDQTVINADFSYYTFNINPSVIQSWISNPSINYGLLLKSINEASGPSDGYIGFYSKENGSQSPLLTIYYTLQ